MTAPTTLMPSVESVDEVRASAGPKAAAQWVLHQVGLLRGPLYVFGADGAAVEDPADLEMPLIARVSPLAETGSTHLLNAPRALCRDADELTAFVDDALASGPCAVIAHRPVEPWGSLEIRLDPTGMRLEHKPGLWETDNAAPADVVEWTSAGVRCTRVTVDREARRSVDQAGVERREPLPLTTLLDVAAEVEDLRPVLTGIATTLAVEPALLHAVLDREGALSFLNVRQLARPIGPASGPAPATRPVSTLDDLAVWDAGVVPLIDLAPGRDDLDDLLDLVDAIKAVSMRVAVADGLLSHVAIVCLAEGLEVVESVSDACEVVSGRSVSDLRGAATEGGGR